ncbi:MAG: DUF2934 domain-containing protein [Bryobacteraceae bacterium]|nr:DUF2934 domain-containing protein [Bryobacteraceae bacterium]
MAKKRNAEKEPVVKSENAAAPAAAKMAAPAKATRPAAAATHKAPAKRTAKSSARIADQTDANTPQSAPVAAAAPAPAPEPAPASPKGMQEASASETRESMTNLAAAVTFDLEAEREEIAKLAYSYWEMRGGVHGYALEDWLRAEAEIRARKLRGIQVAS